MSASSPLCISKPVNRFSLRCSWSMNGSLVFMIFGFFFLSFFELPLSSSFNPSPGRRGVPAGLYLLLQERKFLRGCSSSFLHSMACIHGTHRFLFRVCNSCFVWGCNLRRLHTFRIL